MEDEPIAVGSEDKGHAQHLAVFERLLHPVAYAVRVVLRLHDSERDVGAVVEDVVGAFSLAALGGLSSHDDAPFGKRDLFAYLCLHVPACAFDSGGDVLGADVAFG